MTGAVITGKDDPDFDIDFHVRRVRLPAGADQHGFKLCCKGSFSMTNKVMILPLAPPDLGEAGDVIIDDCYPDANGLTAVVRQPHQIYFRVGSVQAMYRQGLLLFASPGIAPSASELPAKKPDFHGAFVAESGWHVIEPKDEAFTYTVVGVYEDFQSLTFFYDSGLRHTKQVYANGVLHTLGFDDTGNDLDYDDLVVELAVVWRTPVSARLGVGMEISIIEDSDAP